MINTKTIDAISDERELQDKEHGVPNNEDKDWALILMEEVGEVAKEVLCGGRPQRAYELRQELIQVAAVAVAWIEDIDGQS